MSCSVTWFVISVWKVCKDETREPLEEATLLARFAAGGGVGVGIAAAGSDVKGVEVAVVLVVLVAGVDADG